MYEGIPPSIYEGPALLVVLGILSIAIVIATVAAMEVFIGISLGFLSIFMEIWVLSNLAIHVLKLFYLIYIFTFPGVIFHEFSHYIMCILCRVRVKAVKFFRRGHIMGYVTHESTGTFWKHFLIIMVPFFVNTILSLLFFLAAFLMNLPLWLSLFFLWLGISAAIHATPDVYDAHSLWMETKKEAKKWNILAIFCSPVVLVVFVLNTFGGYMWDLLYAFCLLIVGFFAFVIKFIS